MPANSNAKCRGPTTEVPSLGQVATGQQCTDCFQVTRSWLVYDGGETGLGLCDEDNDLVGRMVERWAPSTKRVVRVRGKVDSKHVIPNAPSGAPAQWGLGIHGLPTEKLQLPIIAGRLEDQLARHDAQGWHWLCGFCPTLKHFFFYQHGPDGKTTAAQWVWPFGGSGIFRVPVAVVAGN